METKEWTQDTQILELDFVKELPEEFVQDIEDFLDANPFRTIHNKQQMFECWLEYNGLSGHADGIIAAAKVLLK